MVFAGLFISVRNAMRDRAMFVSTKYYHDYRDILPDCPPHVDYFWTSAANVTVEDGVLATIHVRRISEAIATNVAGLLLKPIESGIYGENLGGISSDEGENNSSQISSDTLRDISSHLAQKERVFRLSELCHCVHEIFIKLHRTPTDNGYCYHIVASSRTLVPG
jgi:hypothetical protein